MIDKIRLRVEGAKADTAHIKDWRRLDTHTGTGHLGNVKISQYLDGVGIIGSLAKYLNGENMTPLTRRGVETAIRKLETETGISLGAAIVTQIEVGKTCVVKRCPSEYIRLFGDPPRYGRHEYRRGGMVETVNYSTPHGSYSLCVYDKAAEMKGRGAKIPALFEACNCLRIEYGIDRRQGIKARFGHDLTAYDLFEYETYRRLQMLFLESYKAIPKTGRVVCLDKARQVTPAELEKQEAAAYREAHNDTHLAAIQTLKEAGAISDKNLERIRERDRRQRRDYTTSDVSPLIAELDGILERVVSSVV
ncbi:MAG: hypothetical protein LBC51_03915 [Treponema sp.]|nr:hypothetical protein [Treponema sp.]